MKKLAQSNLPSFLALQSLLSSISWGDLVVSVESWSLWRSSDSPVSSRSNSDDLGVNSTRDTVLQLVVSLWQSVLSVDGGLGQISDSSSLNNVSDSHSLDSLVLWNGPRAVNTSDWSDVTSTLLVSTVGSSLLWHFWTRIYLFIYMLEAWGLFQ